MTRPTTTTTTTGADLPLVALPQSELLTVNDNEMPWLEELRSCSSACGAPT